MSTISQLKAEVKNYDWGAQGLQSKVAQYALSCSPFDVSENMPYAELWMGTHPSGPSKLLLSGQDLKQYLAERPELLGEAVHSHFGSDLPFLFKVLAVSKALSIQAHPDKQLAARLHRDRPEIYKDDNHKPEMAIALTPFKAFCGFLPPREIAKFLDVVPELASIVPPSISEYLRGAISVHQQPPLQSPADPIKDAIRQIFGTLMKAPTSIVQDTIGLIVRRYNSGGATPEEYPIKDLLVTLNNQFPADVGILCIFLLNIVSLEPGQAIFLQANEPHAYLSGDIIEVMATSDNVVRAGLTPKLRDVDTLVSMLTYSYHPAHEQVLEAQNFRHCKYTKLYDPPIEEFAVLLTELEPEKEEDHGLIAGPSIIIITEGSGVMKSQTSPGGKRNVQTGEIFFIGAGTPVTLMTNGKNKLTAFRAFVERPL